MSKCSHFSGLTFTLKAQFSVDSELFNLMVVSKPTTCCSFKFVFYLFNFFSSNKINEVIPSQKKSKLLFFLLMLSELRLV